MSEPKFTKGPWVTKDREITGPVGVAVARAGICAIVSGRHGSYSIGESEALANARLMGAAPELFEALEALLLDMQHRVRDEESMAKARAALAKALGN